jgi:sugar O-acyltransferase (sialic acid O-acetyltransferase NeuD family)
MANRIIFWGATGQAKVLHEFIGQIGYELVALFDNNPNTPSPFPDVPIYYGMDGFKNWRRQQPESELACLVAIGGSRGQDRLAIQQELAANLITFIIAIHPTAFVAANASIGKGCQILAQSSVCAEVVMGEACIINTAASVDHESILGNGVHIAPGATLAGCVKVGDYSLIGTAAVVLPRIKIGNNVIVGAGSVVTKDIPDNQVVYGNPAKIIRVNN